MIAGVVVLHIWALHVPGNNNPTGVDVKSKQDTVPFHPYYTVKDGFALVVFLILFAWLRLLHARTILGHPDNYIPANPLVTPAHIVPEWYFLPFYAILRAIPDKLLGVIAMFGSIAMLFFAALARHLAGALGATGRSIRQFFWIFVVVCVGARLSRRRSRRKAATCIAVAHPDGLLLRLLPDHPAAPRPVRDAEAVAAIDLRIGAGQVRRCRGQRRSDGRAGRPVRRR